MITKTRISATLIIATLAVGVGAYAIAGHPGDELAERTTLRSESDSLRHSTFTDERSAVLSASVSLRDAILTAETEVGGRAIEAGVEDGRDNTFYYEVEVITTAGVEKDVFVDMKTGKVVKVEDDDH